MGRHSGASGIGSHKHGISGRAGTSPRRKFMRALEDNRERAGRRKRPRLKHSTVDGLVRDFKPR
jgi:hypothetical protein